MAKKIRITVLDKNDDPITNMVWSKENDAKAFMFDAIMKGHEVVRSKFWDTKECKQYFMWQQ